MTKTDVFTILNAGEDCVFFTQSPLLLSLLLSLTLTALAPTILHFCNLTFSNKDKYILSFGQTHLASGTNTFCILDKYILQCTPPTSPILVVEPQP